MRLIRRSALLGFLLLGLAGLPAGPATAQTPFTLEWKTKMKFGKVAPETGAGGTVVLSPNANTTTITGNLTDFGGTIIPSCKKFDSLRDC